MSKRNRLRYAFIILCLVLFIITRLSTSNAPYRACRDREEYMKDKEICGIVTKKFRDKEDHIYPKLIIKESNNKELKLNLVIDKSGLFDFIQVNDSIVKEKESLYLIVFRKGEKYEYTLEYNCIERKKY